MYIATDDSEDIEYEERHRRRMQMIAVSDALDTPWGGNENRMSLFSNGRRRASSDLLSGSSSNESGLLLSQAGMPAIQTHQGRIRQSLTGHQAMPRVNSMPRTQGSVHHTGHAAAGGIDTYTDIESAGGVGMLSRRVQALEDRVTNVEKRVGFFSADDNLLEVPETADKGRTKKIT